MKVSFNGKDTVLTDVKDFNLKETLECGQCFNFVRTDESTDSSFCAYRIIAGGRVLFISEKRSPEEQSYGDSCDLTLHDISLNEYEAFWKNYFDLETDYGMIKKSITEACPELKDIIKVNPGIRLLNQEFFETLISFIISQNKQIPQIKAVVRNLSVLAGRKVKVDISEYRKMNMISEAFLTYCRDDMLYETYLFPTESELGSLSEDDIRSCKAGFRAPYIMDAVSKVGSGEITSEILDSLPTDKAREKLMTIRGVGEKVANCILLYSLGRREAFPVDVWMKRIMESLYFHEDTDKKVIEAFACDKFRKYAGYAQQYLFIYGKDNLKKK